MVFTESRKHRTTVSLDGRFISSVVPGAWIGGRATLCRQVRTLAGADAEAFEDDKLLVTATAILGTFDARPDS